MKKGLLITFEGGEGSGKSTIIKRLVQELQAQYPDIVLTREPGGTKISEEIRKIILDKDNVLMDKKTEALLYAASRRQHLIETVFPALDSHKIVLSDRYLDSSLVYQGYARGIGISEVLDVNLFAIDNRLPDLTILFDLRPEVGLKRIKSNSREINRLDLEALEFHKKVHEGYLILQKQYGDRIKKVDAEQPIEDVYCRVRKLVEEKIKEYE